VEPADLASEIAVEVLHEARQRLGVRREEQDVDVVRKCPEIHDADPGPLGGPGEDAADDVVEVLRRAQE
jgi:hypothetical protein